MRAGQHLDNHNRRQEHEQTDRSRESKPTPTGHESRRAAAEKRPTFPCEQHKVSGLQVLLPHVTWGVLTTLSTHCAEWLWLEMSWNGSQNAGLERSPPTGSPSSTSTAAIQICGDSHPSRLLMSVLSCGLSSSGHSLG